MSGSQRPDTYQDAKNVVKAQQDQATKIERMLNRTSAGQEASIKNSERLISKLGKSLPTAPRNNTQSTSSSLIIPARKWADIVDNAKRVTPSNISFEDLLTSEEIKSVLERHDLIGKDLGWFESLDRFDLALAVCAGTVAGLIDILLVKVPAHPGFLGSRGSEGGWLPGKVNELFAKILPEEKVRILEQAHKASYDPATSRGLFRKIAGLGPRTHRYQSLGHDPILGFFFGVRDILTGQFTAVDKYGKVIIQQVGAPLLEGEMLLVRILEALKTHVGHLLSDVATPAGLPAPLMPLLSFLQFGKIGNQEYTIAEVARQMYRSGYDFRFSVASGVPVLIANIIIALGNFIKTKRSEPETSTQFPNTFSPRKLTVRRQLLIAHSAGMLINAGKVSVTRNPMAFSWMQTLAFLRYVAPEMYFLMHGKEGVRAEMVEEEILSGWHTLNNDIDGFLATQTDFLIEL